MDPEEASKINEAMFDAISVLSGEKAPPPEDPYVEGTLNQLDETRDWGTLLVLSDYLEETGHVLAKRVRRKLNRQKIYKKLIKVLRANRTTSKLAGELWLKKRVQRQWVLDNAGEFIQPIYDAIIEKVLWLFPCYSVPKLRNLQKWATDAANDFTRTRMREASFHRRILPPQPITDAELDAAVLPNHALNPDNGWPAPESVDFLTVMDNETTPGVVVNRSIPKL